MVYYLLVVIGFIHENADGLFSEISLAAFMWHALGILNIFSFRSLLETIETTSTQRNNLQKMI